MGRPPEARELAMPPRERISILADMQRVTAQGVRPTEGQARAQLVGLTKELISASGGRDAILRNDPYQSVLQRDMEVSPEVGELLKGKKVLVTGGEGCVGQSLINRLTAYSEIGAVISVDKAPKADSHGRDDGSVKYYDIDITNYEDLKAVFDTQKPDIVFHLAAQQHVSPGEDDSRETIGSNVFGTENVIRVSEETGVDRLVYSSTAKAGQYFNPAHMATTKKISEWLLAEAVQKGSVKYSMTRFAHVANNSDMLADIKSGLGEGLVQLHLPDRRIYAQSVDEASGLLLNAALIPTQGALRFATTVDSGLMVNNVDVALHEIVKHEQETGELVPLYFAGLADGYEPGAFVGQFDLEGMGTPPLRVNRLEAEHTRRPGMPSQEEMLGEPRLAQAGELFVAETIPFDSATLRGQMDALRSTYDDDQSTPSDLKDKIVDFAKNMVVSQFLQTDQNLVYDVLRRGIKSSNAGQHLDQLNLLVLPLRARLSGLDV